MEDYLQWEERIRSVASRTAQNFPDIDVEDLSQDLMMFVLEKEGALEGRDEPLIRAALNRAAHTFAWNQRKQHLQLTAQYAYRTDDVRKVLEKLSSYANWEKMPVPDDARSLKGNDSVEISSDVKMAFDKMTHKPYRDAIVSRYGKGVVPAQGSAESKRLSRAIACLTDILNYGYDSTDRAGPGSRTAVNNATAQYRIREVS